MSLEEALSRNSELLSTNNSLLEQLLSKTAGAPAKSGTEKSEKAETKSSADAGEGTEQKRRGRPPNSAKAEAAKSAITLDSVKAKLGPWLNEFPKQGDEDHPETATRKVELKDFFRTIGVGKLPEITKQDDIDKLNAWADETIGKGRLCPDEDVGDEDDMLSD